MGLKDLFRRKPADYNEQLIQEAEAQREAEAERKADVNGSVSAGWSGGDTGGAASTQEADTAPSGAVSEAVVALLADGRQIEAIKLYRHATGAGLKESKDAVEAIAAGRPPDPLPTPRASPTLADVEALYEQGQLIDAIKLYREIHGVGLKEAKEAVEAMRAGEPQNREADA